MIYKDKEKLQAKFIDGFIKNEFYDVIFNYWTLLKNKQINNQKKIEKKHRLNNWQIILLKNY